MADADFLRIPHGTTKERSQVVLPAADLMFDTSLNTLIVGDNVTRGGVALPTQVANLPALKALPQPASDGALVFVRGFNSEGDGGEGVFVWANGSAVADDRGMIVQSNAGGTGRWKRLTNGSVCNAKWFGAKGDGVADDTSALQAAVDFCQNNGKGALYIPAGTYKLNGITSPDSYKNGIVIKYRGALDWDNGLHVCGAGRATRLLAGSDSMILVRCAGENCKVSDLVLDGGGRTNVWGLGVVPESLTQTTTRVGQQYDTFENLFILSCAEGIVQTPGPSVAGASGSYYNRYSNIHVYLCRRGIWLRVGVANDNINNRNTFEHIRVGGGTGCNTGLHIAGGDTNTFVACHFEGIQSGTSPSATPTAIKIDQMGGRMTNDANTFISCKLEACTRDVDNANPYTEFQSCSYNISGNKVLLTARPRFSVGGYDTSNTPLILEGLVAQNNNILSGFPVGCLSIDNALLSGIYDKDGPLTTFAITPSNTENIASVTECQSQWWKLSKSVEWHVRLAFAGKGSGSPGGIKINLPAVPNLDLHRNHANVQPSKFPLVVLNAQTGREAVVVACFSHQKEALNSQPFLLIPPPSPDTYFGTGKDNQVWFSIRYRV